MPDNSIYLASCYRWNNQSSTIVLSVCKLSLLRNKHTIMTFTDVTRVSCFKHTWAVFNGKLISRLSYFITLILEYYQGSSEWKWRHYYHYCQIQGWKMYRFSAAQTRPFARVFLCVKKLFLNAFDVVKIHTGDNQWLA